MKIVLQIVLWLLMLPVELLVDSVLVADFWNWFAATTLGAPHIGLAQALGLGFLWQAFALDTSTKREERTPAVRFVTKLFAVFILWLLGYLFNILIFV